MLHVLRFVGLMNAAIWLGGVVFFSAAGIRAVFQPAIRALFHEYYVGTMAQALQASCFTFQLICASVAVAHLLLLWWLKPRQVQRPLSITLGVLCMLVLLGAFLFQPRMKALFESKYRAPTWAQRQTATSHFRTWHAVSQCFNLVVLGGLVFYVWRMAAPAEELKFVSAQKPQNPFSVSERV
jgi:hypothetical protein